MSSLKQQRLQTSIADLSYYRTKTIEHNFDILFIHGLGGNKEWFPRHYDLYSISKFSWIVPDLIGHGNSAKSNLEQAYLMDQQARSLHQLLLKEKVKSLVIIAHSMGGPIAISLIEQLIQEKDQIKVIGLFYLEGNLDKNDTFFSSQIAKYSCEEFENEFDSWIETLNKKTKGRLVEFIAELQKIGPFPLWATSVDLVSVSLSNQLLPRLQSTLKGSNCPIYFIYGEKNKGLFSSEILIKQAQLPLIFIPDAGHVMFEDNPNGFWKIIMQSLSQLKTQ
ncbi:MAG: alpha/beta fold hydrolase [Promethearchaeota archaeon]